MTFRKIINRDPSPPLCKRQAGSFIVGVGFASGADKSAETGENVMSRSRFLGLTLSFLLCLSLSRCASEDSPSIDGDRDSPDDDVSESDDPSDGDTEADHPSDVPEDIPPLVNERPFTVERPDDSPAVAREEIDAFSREYAAFFENSDYFRWLSRYSQGLPENNPGGYPGYKVWWTHLDAVKSNGVVTLQFSGTPDNSTAKVGRAIPPVLGYALRTGDETARDLAVGYIKGLSATFDGMVYPDEDPVTDSIMARAIFHQSYEIELDGGRKLKMDYEPVRVEEVARRHDTWHNPDNPTYGDIYVRNKRSKDDLLYVYRTAIWLLHAIHESDDDELRNAAIKLFRQIRAMSVDIVEHEYCIRTKDGDGVPYIPTLESGVVDDFASFTSYENIFPFAECNAKLGTSYMAYGEKRDIECSGENFYGDGGAYETAAITSHYWGSNMIWGYHLTALALALAYNDAGTARKLMDGYITRMEDLQADERADGYPEWWPDMAQLLVLGAAYGMPLKADEARLIHRYYREGMAHYNAIVPWDIWEESVPDDTPYSTLPSRADTDVDGNVTKSYVRPTEIMNPFEYCASPLRAENGAQFIDCDLLLYGE